MESHSVYAITGANRGIGLGLVEAYLAQPFTVVVAIVRSNDAAASLEKHAKELTTGNQSSLQIVQLDFTKIDSPESIRNSFLGSTNGINHVNTLIYCAGHVTSMAPAINITAKDLREVFEVNTIAPLIMFQALWPLMETGLAATAAPPKFIMLSSSVGSIGGMEPFPGGAYGPSKAAVNHIVKSLHQQMGQSQLVSVALHPGWVKTAMGNVVAKDWNYTAGPPDTVEDSVKGILQVVDGATRENVSGKFVTQTGEEIPW
jgi:NAD(P)-dependent dehydrogenase (short-subunit alcohol dehydrogenase family)